jgi:hypothetical protein
LPKDLNDLVKAVAADRIILFVGGGISQSLGLPDFRALVVHLADELGFPADPLSIEEYAGSLKHTCSSTANWDRCAHGWIRRGTPPTSISRNQRFTT